MKPLFGEVIDGKYLVGECLGEGGMGAVFLAEHIGIGRTVALKIVQPELLSDTSAAERFKREARAAGALRHPNVVNVTDFGVADVAGEATAYLVMEHLHGRTLADVIKSRKALPARLIVDIVDQVAEALAAAHARGVVHRDLKPANIWLSPDERGGFRVTLLDFGIAKLRDDAMLSSGRLGPEMPMVESPAPDAETLDLRLAPTGSDWAPPEGATRVGEIVGTPAYMSPEQCAGADIDGRSDIYSLGIVVYQLFAGELPFRGSSIELLRQHFVADVPPFAPEARVRERVARAVRRALAKDPDDRFQTAKGFAAALRANATGVTECLRRATALFAERLPELLALGVWFAVPGIIATGVGIALWRTPYLWIVALMLAMLISVSVAMATIAAIFDDLRDRPFVHLTWRRAARAVLRRDMATPQTLLLWLFSPPRRYLRCLMQSRGSSVLNMLMFVDLFRREGKSAGRLRLERMAKALPKGAFDTMAALQLFGTFIAPLLAIAAAYGVQQYFHRPNDLLVALAGSAAFTATLLLQTLVALVDVMLFDLAYDLTAE
jgi:hypothetical protein